MFYISNDKLITCDRLTVKEFSITTFLANRTDVNTSSLTVLAFSDAVS